jgi:hypothetical protein
MALFGATFFVEDFVLAADLVALFFLEEVLVRPAALATGFLAFAGAFFAVAFFAVDFLAAGFAAFVFAVVAMVFSRDL